MTDTEPEPTVDPELDDPELDDPELGGLVATLAEREVRADLREYMACRGSGVWTNRFESRRVLTQER